MIKHVVCFKLKDNSLSFCQKTKELLLSMEGKVKYLVKMEVGIDFLHSNRSYDIILETYFLNKEDLDKYQQDEYHCNVIKKFMHENTTASIAVDYEIGD